MARFYGVGDGLPHAVGGPIVGFEGGSNIAGFNVSGGFYTDVPGGQNPYTLPDGVELWVGAEGGASAQVLAYNPTAVHGPWVGFIQRLVDLRGASFVDGLRIVVRTRNATPWADYAAGANLNGELVADFAARGWTPNLLCMHFPNSDTTTSGLGLAAESKYPAAIGSHLLRWPQVGVIVEGPLLEDDGTNPGNDVARLTIRKWIGVGQAGELSGRLAWRDCHDDIPLLQSDGEHRGHLAMVQAGADLADIALAWNMIRAAA